MGSIASCMCNEGGQRASLEREVEACSGPALEIGVVDAEGHNLVLLRSKSQASVGLLRRQIGFAEGVAPKKVQLLGPRRQQLTDDRASLESEGFAAPVTAVTLLPARMEAVHSLVQLPSGSAEERVDRVLDDLGTELGMENLSPRGLHEAKDASREDDPDPEVVRYAVLADVAEQPQQSEQLGKASLEAPAQPASAVMSALEDTDEEPAGEEGAEPRSTAEAVADIVESVLPAAAAEAATQVVQAVLGSPEESPVDEGPGPAYRLAEANQCSRQPDESPRDILVQIINDGPRSVDLKWVDFHGRPRDYARAIPAEVVKLETTAGHVWKVLVAELDVELVAVELLESCELPLSKVLLQTEQ